jgi:hypothetical protein
VREYEYEPINGLPEELPEGEVIVWQGAPQWTALANRVFQVRTLALYFAALIGIHVVYKLMDGASSSHIWAGVTWQLTLAAVSLGLLAGAAWLYARSTVYTLTNKRLVLRSGVATPMMVNLPLEKLESAGLRLCSDGTGDMLFTPTTDTKLYYLLLWPHVRLLGFRKIQPLFRGISDAQNVARLLAKTVRSEGMASLEGGLAQGETVQTTREEGFSSGQPVAAG